ncbi:kinase-like protein [Exidia glandulosa HHB12029]|uniref:Kinase-like protein n=1 Tax=Exidia glandulosa HHB12029 TaxID=1314781 RepID=A0A165L208_EXIGL|nr:kinase-like protein [Exidia glandulosa HHB12029]
MRRSCASRLTLVLVTSFDSPALQQGFALDVQWFDDSVQGPAFVLSTEAVGHGASAVIMRGETPGNQPRALALKVFHAYSKPYEDELRKREVSAWRRLRHPRLLELLGTATFGTQQVLVSPYIRNGNMLQYLKRFPDADRLRLIMQTVEGIVYLHDDVGYVHGDIKCENVLISDSGDALLADFGLSIRISKTKDEEKTCTDIRTRSTVRFAAPEILMEVGDRSKTIETDVYAVGGLIYQTYVGAPPWVDIPQMQMFYDVCVTGRIPDRPGKHAIERGLDDPLWSVCTWCWEMDAPHRPQIQLISHALAMLKKAGMANLTGLIPWMEDRMPRQRWTWTMLNGFLSFVVSSDMRDAFSGPALTNILHAMTTTDKTDADELRTTMRHFIALVSFNTDCALHILHAGGMWKTFFAMAHAVARPELLEIIKILVGRLKKLITGEEIYATSSGRQALVAWTEHLRVVKQSVDRLFMTDLTLLIPSSNDGCTVEQCDTELQNLIRATVPVLAPDRWATIRAATKKALPRINESRRVGFTHMIDAIDERMRTTQCQNWSTYVQPSMDKSIAHWIICKRQCVPCKARLA